MEIEIIMETICRLLGVVLVTEFAIIAGLKLLNIEENGKSVKNNVAMMGFTVLGIGLGAVIAFNNVIINIIVGIIGFGACIALFAAFWAFIYAIGKLGERVI
jgi:hypothetical protein